MLELDTNKAKSIDFEIQLSGIDSKQLEGSLDISIDGIDHGFKAEITPTNIIVNVPALKNIFLREFKEGEQFSAKLEVHGAGYYLNPWSGSFVVKNPVTMEVKIREDVEVPKITAKIRSESSGEKAKSKLNEMKKVVSKPIEVKSKGFGDKKPISIKDIVITEKHIFGYMESKGTTSEQVQKLILEQCKSKSKTDDPKDVLRAVIKFYKNKN